jgi:hypothetical protein
MNRNLGSHNTFRKYVTLALTLLAGFSIGFVLRGIITGKSMHQNFGTRQGGWHYINPLL